MAIFRISLRQGFGDVSVEGNEKEVIENLDRLKTLAKTIEKELGFDLSMPNAVVQKATKLEYIDRIMVLMNYLKKPVTKLDCKKYTKTLSIPEHWWNGSNFERDMRKRKAKNFIKILRNDPIQYILTKNGKTYIKNALTN